MAQLPVKALRQRAIVRIEARQQRRASLGQAAVECRHQPERILPDHADTRLALRPFVKDGGRVVG